MSRLRDARAVEPAPESPRPDSSPPAARTTGAVLDDLTRIVDQSRARRSAVGLFPAMYRSVTATMVEGLERGFFAEAARVERLVVVFADRYIDAFDAWSAGGVPTQAWRDALEFSERRAGSALQHLLLGMNAHINLDLGIATADVSTSEDLPAIRADFDRINVVLFAMLDELQGGLCTVSPWMQRVDRLGLGFDEACMRTGIRTARDLAWRLAEDLVAAPDAEHRSAGIRDRDDDTARIGQLLTHRLSLFHAANRVVCWREPKDVCVVIDALSASRIDLEDLGPVG